MTQINLSFDPGTKLYQILTFKTAANVWESYLQDDVDVNIHVGLTAAKNLPKGVIGGALPSMRKNTSYGEFRDRYWQDVTSSHDTTANEHLLWGSNWVKFEQVNTDSVNVGRYESSDVMSMTQANAKALGFNISDSQELDGYILMNDLKGQSVSWQNDARRQGQANQQKLDFLTTALHEIGHVLGFVSGVDEKGWISADLSDVSPQDFMQTWQAATEVQRDRVKHATPLDNFRYSQNSDGITDLTYGSQFSEKYFSIDGGATQLAAFSSGTDKKAGGDGYQASHWRQGGNGQTGIMAPALVRGKRGNVSSLDLKAMDVIGWDIDWAKFAAGSNFRAAHTEAKQEVAAELGKSTSWLFENRAQAESMLTQDRGKDIFQMLQSSQYDMSWLTPWAVGGGGRFQAWQNFWASGGSSRFQMLAQVFQQEARFSTFADVMEADSAQQPPSEFPAEVDPLIPSPEAGTESSSAPLIGQISTTAAGSFANTDSILGSGNSSFNTAGSEPLELFQSTNLNSQENINPQNALGSTSLSSLSTLIDSSLTTSDSVLSAPLQGLGGDQLLSSGFAGLSPL